ncbi:MAG: hypothetical protein KDA81_07345 [Planctomycetaceae bacterium]|nr:hypothetical protein [Planctomycetaceae bacterium]
MNSSYTNQLKFFVTQACPLIVRIARCSSANQFSIFLTLLSIVVGANGFTMADEEEKPIAAESVELGRAVDFDQEILPILQANCVACHNKAKSEGQLVVENVEAMLKGGAAGPSIVPGKPDESYLYQVAARIEEPQMPPWPNNVQAKKLTPRQVGLLRQWIVEGAKGGAAKSAANMNWQPISDRLQAVYSIAMDPFARFVAAGRANRVTVYDLQARDQVRKLTDPAISSDASPNTAHRDYAHAIAFHPSGHQIATSGYQVVKLWERDLSGAIKLLPLPAGAVKVVSSDNQQLVAAQYPDGVVRVLNIAENKVANEQPGHDPGASPLLGIHGGDVTWLAFGAADLSVNLAKLSDGDQLKSEPLGAAAVQTVFHAASNRLFVVLQDGSVRPLQLNAEAKSLTPADAVKSDKGPIRSLVLSGDQLLVRTEGNHVEVRNIADLKVTATVSAGAPVKSVAGSSDGQRLVTVLADGKAELWNAADGKLVAALTSDLNAVHQLKFKERDKAVYDARVSVIKGQITEDEKRVTEHKESLKKSEEEITRTTMALAEAQKKHDEERGKAEAAKKASEEKPDDADLKKKLEEADKAFQAAKEALTSADNAVKSAMKGKQLSEQAIQRAEAQVADRKKQLESAEQEAAAAAEKHQQATAAVGQTVPSVSAVITGSVVVTTDDSGRIRLWNASDGSAFDVLEFAPQSPVAGLMSCGVSGEICLQSADGQISRCSVFPEWKLARTLGPQGEGQPSVFPDRVLSLAFSPDGSLLAAGGGEASRSGELTIWNSATGELVRRLPDAHSDTVYGIDFSADGKLLATAAADKFVKVFDVATGEHVRSYEGHTHHVMDVAWQFDRTTLASAGADNAIKVWNAETGEQNRTITTYSKQVTALSYIGTRDEFVSCSGDKRVFIHKAANGGTVREFKGCPDYVYCSAVSLDGSTVVAGCEDGVVRAWNGNDGKELATFGAGN